MCDTRHVRLATWAATRYVRNIGTRYALFSRLPQVLLRLVELLLEQLHLARQVFARGPVRVPFLGRRLELLDLALELVVLALGERELVLQRRDLLVSLEQGLVQLCLSARLTRGVDIDG